MNVLGGPMMDKTDISVDVDLIGVLSNLQQFSTKNSNPFSESILIVKCVILFSR